MITRLFRVLGSTAGLVLLAGGCVQPLTQPEPQRLNTPLPAAEVVSRAARALTEMGFEVVVSDAAAGVLTMRRMRAPRGNVELLRCNWTRTSLAESNGTTTITVSLAARPEGASTTVVLSSRTLVTYPRLERGPLAMNDSDDSCISNGTAESAVLRALMEN